MEYLNIHSSTLSSDAFLDSSPEDQAAWLLVLSFCANQENGGRITDARRWDDQKCLRALKVPRVRLHDAALLWHWEGNDLVPEFYPIDQELKRKKIRNGASLGGQVRGQQIAAQAEAKRAAQAEPRAEGTLQPKAKQKEGNKRERKKERGREGGSLSGLSDVPSEAVVREWASSAGVDPDFAAQKRAELCERHGWHQNGRLLDWQSRFQRFWETDGPQWVASRKKTARGVGLPPEALPTDCAWWWADSLENVEATLAGAALQGDEKTAARLREVIAVRKKGAA